MSPNSLKEDSEKNLSFSGDELERRTESWGEKRGEPKLSPALREGQSRTARSAGHRDDPGYSAIFATCNAKPVFGSNDVSSKALKPSPVTSV